MGLNDLWFILIGVLFAGFFFLEGFDFGVGILNIFIAKTDTERRIVVNTIGPFWDANEVWLLTAGGAMFAAFPGWYATLFSGFYMALLLVLVALIVRGVAFEFRSKVESPKWRKGWDIAIFVGSLLPALLFGVAMANLIKGVPIDASGEYVGGFFNLLSPFTLLAGILSLTFFTYLGAAFLSLKLEGELLKRANKALKVLWPITFALAIIALIFAAVMGIVVFGTAAFVLAIFAIVLHGLAFVFIKKQSYGISLILGSFVVVLAVATLFGALYPNVMVSSLQPIYSLTVKGVSSTPYTLKVMTIVTATILPIVILCQIWNYRIFRNRVTSKDLEY